MCSIDPEKASPLDRRRGHGPVPTPSIAIRASPQDSLELLAPKSPRLESTRLELEPTNHSPTGQASPHIPKRKASPQYTGKAHSFPSLRPPAQERRSSHLPASPKSQAVSTLVEVRRAKNSPSSNGRLVRRLRRRSPPGKAIKPYRFPLSHATPLPAHF